MKGGLYVVAIFVHFALVTKADDVLVGTGKNFEKLVKENPFLVAEFYAPWCGHCKSLEPEYSKAATELKSGDPAITLVKVDATLEDNKQLASKYGVQGFPTLKIFREGDADNPQDYNGPRDAAGIVSYLQKKAGPASKPLTSQAEVEAHKKKEPAVLGIFKGEKSSEYQVFSKIASKLSDDLNFGHSFDEDVVEGIAKSPAVVIFKESEGKTESYSGKFKAKELQAWIEAKAVPLLPELDQSSKNKKALNNAFQSSKPKFFGFVAKDDSAYSKFTEELTTMAEGTVGEVFFIMVDPPTNSHALNFFGLKEEDCPAFVIQDGNDKYHSKKTAAGEAAAFLKNFQDGKLEKAIKSEDPPEDNSGPVTVVTAKTFEQIVLSGKDVLVEFYAPWCGHCKKLTPIYEKVGAAFKDNESIVIAKMDATANDIISDKFDVKGFPTINFVSGKDGSVLTYSGDRSEEDLIAYVKEHASTEAKADHEEL